MFNISF